MNEKALTLLKLIRDEWLRKEKAGEKLTPLEKTYLEAIAYVLGETNGN